MHKIEAKPGQFSKEEEKWFVEAIRIFGKDWDKITEYVGTRSKPQICNYSQQFRRNFYTNSLIEYSDVVDILELKLKRGRKPA